MSIEQSSMSGGTRGRSFTGLFAPPKCAASERVIKTGCQLWMIKIIGRLTRPCSGWPLPFTAHSPRGSAWCSTSRKAETMLGRSFSGKTARGPRRRGACGKGRRSTCPRFLACYSNTNKDCIERYERGEVKRRFSKQPKTRRDIAGEKIRGRDHSAQLVELCFLSVLERFHAWQGELVPTTAAPIQDIWSL